MFEPKKFIDNETDYFVYRNNNLNYQLPIFYLLTNDSFIGFPYLPNQIEYGYTSKYNRVTKVLAERENLQFLGNTIDNLNINNLIISSRSSNKTWEQLVNKLNKLMILDTAIAVCLQNRVIGNYVIENLKIVENGWIDGMPCKGTISIQFIQDDRNTEFTSIPDIFTSYSRNENVELNEYSDTKEIEFKPDDTLSKIAFNQYQNVGAWRDLADANPSFNLFETDVLLSKIFLPIKQIKNEQIVKDFSNLIVNNIDWIL